MACGRSGGFAATQEQATRIAKASGEPPNVMESLAYCSCPGDMKVVRRIATTRALREFLARQQANEHV